MLNLEERRVENVERRCICGCFFLVRWTTDQSPCFFFLFAGIVEGFFQHWFHVLFAAWFCWLHGVVSQSELHRRNVCKQVQLTHSGWKSAVKTCRSVGSADLSGIQWACLLSHLKLLELSFGGAHGCPYSWKTFMILVLTWVRSFNGCTTWHVCKRIKIRCDTAWSVLSLMFCIQ